MAELIADVRSYSSPAEFRRELERRLALKFYGEKSWDWERCKALAVQEMTRI